MFLQVEYTQSWTDSMSRFRQRNYCLAKPPESSISHITPLVPGSWYVELKAACLTEH